MARCTVQVSSAFILFILTVTVRISEIEDEEDPVKFSKVKAITKKTVELFVQDKKVQSNWFLSKDNYMFSTVTQKTAKKIEKAPEMLALVNGRSEFICKVILGVGTKACLHDPHGKEKHVPIPATIESDRLPTFIKFTEAQQKCTAAAVGSVTYLSDLDFTVSCKGRAGVKNDNSKQQASDEIIIVEKLTDAIEQILGNSPGEIFDTNFYTNTFAYGPALGQNCDADPMQGVAIGLYAAARGFMQMKDYSDNLQCMRLGLDANPSGLATHRYKNDRKSIPTLFLKEMIKNNPRMLGKLQPRAKEITRNVDFVASEVSVAETGRTGTYINILKEALRDTKYFCIQTAFSLILANEAYWVPGAIKDVVERKASLTVREATESILMNLGYAMEHTAHEFHRGDLREKGDIMKCNYGDGLIKFGKYIQRVKTALSKANMLKGALVGPEVTKLFTQADQLMAAKSRAKDGENKGNAIALPQEYVQQYTTFIGKGLKAQCGFIHELASTSMIIAKAVLAEWK